MHKCYICTISLLYNNMVFIITCNTYNYIKIILCTACDTDTFVFMLWRVVMNCDCQAWSTIKMFKPLHRCLRQSCYCFYRRTLKLKLTWHLVDLQAGRKSFCCKWLPSFKLETVETDANVSKIATFVQLNVNSSVFISYQIRQQSCCDIL